MKTIRMLARSGHKILTHQSKYLSIRLLELDGQVDQSFLTSNGGQAHIAGVDDPRFFGAAAGVAPGDEWVRSEGAEEVTFSYENQSLTYASQSLNGSGFIELRTAIRENGAGVTHILRAVSSPILSNSLYEGFEIDSQTDHGLLARASILDEDFRPVVLQNE